MIAMSLCLFDKSLTNKRTNLLLIKGLHWIYSLCPHQHLRKLSHTATSSNCILLEKATSANKTKPSKIKISSTSSSPYLKRFTFNPRPIVSHIATIYSVSDLSHLLWRFQSMASSFSHLTSQIYSHRLLDWRIRMTIGKMSPFFFFLSSIYGLL